MNGIRILAGLTALPAGLTIAMASPPQSMSEAVSIAPPEAAAEPVPGDPVTVFSRDEMAFSDTGSGARVQLMDEASRTLETLEIHITTLNAGETSHAPHRHPNEEVVVLQEGTLEVYVNGETKVIGPGSVMVFLSMDWHGVRNVGDGPATYQVINFHP
ncbi:cupin domain-containing protein [Parvularcula marina]|uniref:Cupin domain-containing protein n=1 Tax=Parvularcula marina TaxID=2292771 RepID=A0A371RIL3_9PROT|nr:cupin domain-containing protein [Parvularcula marina]RFB05268.1 cupin domain-containing protein [Parvularcula marina]